MLTRQPIRAPRLGAVAAPCRPAGLPSLMPIRPRHAVIRRFKVRGKQRRLWLYQHPPARSPQWPRSSGTQNSGPTRAKAVAALQQPAQQQRIAELP